MCGIAGCLNLSPIPFELVCGAMKHRGPDAQGKRAENTQGGFLQFFHSRLSIQDLSTNANQPMSMGDLTLVFNGEIYNHKALRENLSYGFQTQSDTETILALYHLFGIEMLGMLEGMFAFVLYDKKFQRLILARDRMGKKPLFYYQKGTIFAFGSELNTLCAMFKPEICQESLAMFLRCGFFVNDGTPYQHIQSLPAGSYGIYELNNHTLNIQSYFDLKSHYLAPKITDEKEALRECEQILKASIQERLESSDLEVGAFLSGGIDSSLIVALSSQIKPHIRTFTISFSGAYDESPLAEMTAKHYNTEHTTLAITTDLKNDIEKILQNYGRPFADSSAIPSFYVAKEAKKHLSVILNGDGADELFGGYRRYVGHLLVPKIVPFCFLSPLIPKPKEKKSLLNYGYRLFKMAQSYKNKGLEYYLLATTDIFEGYYDFKADFTSLNQEVSSILHSKLTPLSQMLYLDSKMLLFSDLLPKMDIATMANSLEGRSPFLSSKMVEFATHLSDDLKIKGTQTKYLLRKLAQKYLPKALCEAPKRGFEVPLKAWVEGELKEMIFDALSSPKIANDFLDSQAISDLCFKPHLFPAEKRAKMLWSLFVLEVWYKRYREL